MDLSSDPKSGFFRPKVRIQTLESLKNVCWVDTYPIDSNKTTDKNVSMIFIGPMKGGQSVECQGQFFGNVACQLENGSVECPLYIV